MCNLFCNTLKSCNRVKCRIFGQVGFEIQRFSNLRPVASTTRPVSWGDMGKTARENIGEDIVNLLTMVRSTERESGPRTKPLSPFFLLPFFRRVFSAPRTKRTPDCRLEIQVILITLCMNQTWPILAALTWTDRTCIKRE